MTNELPVWVRVQDMRYCDCCKHNHMKRVFSISHATLFDEFHLGYVCASKWFGINLSGNKFKARNKLQSKLNKMDDDDLMDVVYEILEDA